MLAGWVKKLAKLDTFFFKINAFKELLIRSNKRFRWLICCQENIITGMFRITIVVTEYLCHVYVPVYGTLILLLTCLASVMLIIWWRSVVQYEHQQTLICTSRTSFRIFSPFSVIWNNRLCTYEGATFAAYSGKPSYCLCSITLVMETRNCQEMCQIQRQFSFVIPLDTDFCSQVV